MRRETDDLAVLHEQSPLAFEGRVVARGRSRPGIEQSEQDGGHHCHQDCDSQILFHSIPQARCKYVIITSISLIPMKGAITPPRP